MLVVHRKKANSHEKALEQLEAQRSALSERVSNDRQKTLTAMKVLTDEVARLDKLADRIAS